MSDATQPLELDFPRCLEADFARELPTALAAFEAITGAIARVDLSPLARRSPALRGFDWHGYLRCSVARMVHAAAALRRRGVTSGRLLDYGSYFGNFSLMFARAGFSVDAADSYAAYERVFDRPRQLLAHAGVREFDFATVGYDLRSLQDGYDVVICMGVIEHIPNSPRLLLETLDRVLRPGGVLVLDTPNLVHVYNRQKFARGETIFAEIATQYDTELPFEGHHREYTIPEMVWMLRRVGHRRITVEAFNYSSYALGTLQSRDVTNHWKMVRDASLREYLMTVSEKPTMPSADAPTADGWESLLEDPETYWQKHAPPEKPLTEVDVSGEMMLVRLQQALADAQRETAIRDEMLRKLQDEFVSEVRRRDEMIDRLNRGQDWMRRGWRRLIVRRPPPEL